MSLASTPVAVWGDSSDEARGLWLQDWAEDLAGRNEVGPEVLIGVGLVLTPEARAERSVGDPRRFYFPFMIFLLVVIAIIIRLAVPTRLISITANMSNFGALFFPFVLMYLNSKLPRPAKPPGYTYVLLFLNFLFFGFFFINFVADTFFGGPLVVF